MKKITLDSALNLVLKIVGIFVNYLYISILLGYLGETNYGIWIIIVTITSWLSFFDIGLGNGLRNKLTEAIEKKEEQNSLVSSTYYIVSRFMAVICSVGILLALLLKWRGVFKTNINELEIKIVIVISLIFMALNVVLSLVKSVCFALQKSVLASSTTVISQTINFCIFIILKNITCVNLPLLAIIYGMSEFIVFLGLSYYLYSKYPNLKPNRRNIEKKCEIELLKIGSSFFILQVCALVLYSTDSIIISCLYSANSVTPYSIVIKLYTLIINVFASLIIPLWSAVTKEKAMYRWDVVGKYIKYITYLMVPLVIIVAIVSMKFRLICFIWLKTKLEYSNLLIILGGIYCILSVWCNSFATISNGLGILKKPIFFAIIQAVLNLPLSLFFAYCLDMKSAGVLLGTIAVMIIGTVMSPYLVIQKMKENNV